MTAIPFPDIVVESAAGVIRLEIRSPDNDPVRPRAVGDLPEGSPRRFWGGFQSDLVYRAVRVRDGKVVWRWRQPDDGTGPVEAWVDDDAAAVVATKHASGSELLVFDDGGRLVGSIDVGDLLEERDFHWTSAGPIWYERAGSRFVVVGGVRYWCARLQSGTRVCVDVGRAAVVRASAAVIAAAEADERRWALRTLERVAPIAGRWRRWPEGEGLRQYEELMVAAQWAGEMGIAEAVEWLYVMEACAMDGDDVVSGARRGAGGGGGVLSAGAADGAAVVAAAGAGAGGVCGARVRVRRGGRGAGMGRRAGAA